MGEIKAYFSNKSDAIGGVVDALCLCSDLPNLHLGTPFDFSGSIHTPKIKCRIDSNPGASEEDNCLTQRCCEKTAVIGILLGTEPHYFEFISVFFCMGDFYHFNLILQSGFQPSMK